MTARGLGTGVTLLCCAAAVCVALPRDAGRAARSDEFQRLVGGLGLGPATTLPPCEPDFDPRVGAVCDGAIDPVPAGGAFCAHRDADAAGR